MKIHLVDGTYELFRNHLSNVYRALDSEPPEELARSVLRAEAKVFSQRPTGIVRPVIDGEVTSYFEWMGAGVYRASHRGGAMHGRRFLVGEIHYGADGANFFLRVDFLPEEQRRLPGMEVHLTLEGADKARISILLGDGAVEITEGDPLQIEICFGRVLEMRVPLEVAGPRDFGKLRFQLSLWQDGLPVDALPVAGWIELETKDPGEWAV